MQKNYLDILVPFKLDKITTFFLISNMHRV